MGLPTAVQSVRRINPSKVSFKPNDLKLKTHRILQVLSARAKKQTAQSTKKTSKSPRARAINPARSENKEIALGFMSLHLLPSRERTKSAGARDAPWTR